MARKMYKDSNNVNPIVFVESQNLMGKKHLKNFYDNALKKMGAQTQILKF